MLQNTKSRKGFFIGFLAGSTLGAITALLTTPKNGGKLKKELKQKSVDYLDEVEKYFSETKHHAGKVRDESKRKFASILHDIKSKPKAIYRDAENILNYLISKTKEVINSGKESIETETGRLKSSVKSGIDTYTDEKKTKNRINRYKDWLTD